MESTDKNWINQTTKDISLWFEKSEWKGYDPFDGLTSPLLKKLSQNRWMRLAFLQLVKRSPFNLRPLLGIKPQENAMTWAAVILGSLEAYQRGEIVKRDFIQKAVERLLDLQTEGTNLWGYPFPWQSKAFYLKAREPNLVLSSLCLRALAKTMLVLGEKTDQTETLKEHYQKAANNLFQVFFKPGEGYFSYTAPDAVLVHNANLFGVEAILYAKPLGITLSMDREQKLLEALQKTLQAQSPSGRWSYGTKPHHHWCDNFHTAYNLIALANIYSLLPFSQIPPAIEKGLDFYLTHAFTQKGEARYYDNQTYPLEAHSSAAALICLWEMTKGGWIDATLAQDWTKKISDCLKKEFYLGEGEFIYRKGRYLSHKMVFTRWTQAWAYYGLESLSSLLSFNH